jgi:hypothetical protein
MDSVRFTTGKSKLSVSETMVFKTSSGISGLINCLIASNAIASFESVSIVSKKEAFKGVIFSGKYKPLSGASPLMTAFSKVVFGAI